MAEDLPYGLTRLQRDTLLIVQELTELDGIAPTLAEIQHELCASSRGRVHHVLVCLRDRGFVDWLPCLPRSLVVRRPIPVPASITEAFAPTA